MNHYLIKYSFINVLNDSFTKTFQSTVKKLSQAFLNQFLREKITWTTWLN